MTYGETKPFHFEEMKEREWILGDDTVDELYEYKSPGVLENYIGSFSSNVEDNIDKTRKKAGMIFSSNFDRRKVNPFVHIKFWSQACLPSLLPQKYFLCTKFRSCKTCPKTVRSELY